MKNFLFAITAIFSAVLCGSEYGLGDIKISAPEKHKFAVQELKKHLTLAGSKSLPGKRSLTILIGQKGNPKNLKQGETRWLYKKGKLYIWGRDLKNYPATLFAVYDFLEAKLGVRWIYPGDDGIFVPRRQTLSFKENESGGRIPPYYWASVRHGLWHGYHRRTGLIPREWLIDSKKIEELKQENTLFHLRHRNGRIRVIRYAHAFTKWPDRFEKTRPDYFGVGPYGKPLIPPNRKTAKICLSNPAVIDQIIADWQKAGARPYLNVSPNDGTPGFCLCSKCMALDTRKPGENFYAHLTDRYLNFWNRIAKRAVKINPNVKVTTYVYSYYRHPPRRERIEYPENMFCGLVPALAEDSGALFDAWKKAGMKHCFLRPNDTHPASAQIRGLAKVIFDKYQSSRASFKLYGVDYDSTLGIKARDLEHYVVERMITHPDKSFEEIMDEFCSAYGAAGSAVKEFYSALHPAGAAMYLKSASSLRNRQALDDSLVKVDHSKVYEEIIKKGLKKLETFPENKLSPAEKKRLDRLIFSLRQNILANDFRREGDLALAGKKNSFTAAAKKLWDFRSKTIKTFPEHYPDIVYRTERLYWNMYQPFRQNNSGSVAADPAAGWRNSFDEPSLQGWSPRAGFRQITTKEASFDRYSIETKPIEKSAIILFRPQTPVTPGAKYTISYDVKSALGGKFRLRVTAKGKTLTNISTAVKGSHWVQKKGTFTVPAGTKHITLYLYGYNLPRGGYIDNIVLTRLNSK